MNVRPRYLACLVLVGACLLAACGPRDPKQRVLRERERWDVQLLTWVQTPDGLNANVRIGGPPSSSLTTLTVRFELKDANGSTRESVWRSFDLAQVPRGGPADLSVRLAAADFEVEELAVVHVLSPSPEEEPFIEELP